MFRAAALHSYESSLYTTCLHICLSSVLLTRHLPPPPHTHTPFHLLPADALIKLVPTLTAGLALWVCMTRATSPWALPVTLAAVPAAFHVFLLVSGTTLAQAQDAGWVLKPEVREIIFLAVLWGVESVCGCVAVWRYTRQRPASLRSKSESFVPRAQHTTYSWIKLMSQQWPGNPIKNGNFDRNSSETGPMYWCINACKH